MKLPVNAVSPSLRGAGVVLIELTPAERSPHILVIKSAKGWPLQKE